MALFGHILVPTDFGGPSEHAVELGLEMALRFDAKLTLFHAPWTPNYYDPTYNNGMAFPLDQIEARAKVLLEEVLVKAKARNPRVASMMVAGVPWEEILAAVTARGADLVVMGTHGRRGLSRVFLGSVAEKVVRHSTVPVLTTPGAAEK